MSATSTSADLFIPPADAAIWQALPRPRVVAAGSGLVRAAGWLLLIASVGFLVVFAWLAAHFGYPDVLDQPAATVLPALHALGNTGRAVWAIYAVIPLLLIPAIALVGPALRRDERDAPLLHTALALQVVSSLAMTLGLARWSTLQWTLAERYLQANTDLRGVIAATSDAANSYLGNAIGEFVGELTLYGVFVSLAILLWRRGQRMLAMLGVITAAAGWVGMFRNITPTVNAVAALSNGLLPLFLIALGATLVWRGGVVARSAR